MSLFQKYKERGYLVIPEKNGIPLVKWGELKLSDNIDFIHKECDYGLITGERSNIIGIDIDTNDKDIITQIESIAGISPIKKFGSKGFTAFYIYNGEESTNWKKDNKLIVELLSNGRKTTIPPSIHRETGKEYKYLAGDLLDSSIELPVLNKDFITVMDILYPKPEHKVYNSVNVLDDVDITEANDMLDCISSDLCRDEWISIGMSLKSEYGDSAFQLWDNWSSTGSTYKAHEMYNTWRSFTSVGVGIGTLVWYAKNNGYIKTSTIKKEDIIFNPFTERRKKLNKKQEILKPHGLVGMIADWITSTAIRPQPDLSLAAAITFVGMVKGHKYKTNTNLRSNILTLSIAPTGAGKEHPQNCLWQLIKACDLQKNSMSEPTSGTALLKGILKANRVGLLVIDEIGRYLSTISNKNSGGYQQEIISYIIKSFSKANSFLVGKQYADEKTNPRIDIINPHLCVMGASVIERITEACSSSDAIDGFLNRWLIFESKERPKRTKSYLNSSDVPQEIINEVNKIKENFTEVYAEDKEPQVKKINYDSEAYSLMESYIDKAEEIQNDVGYPLDALYGRSAEHAAKLALIMSDNHTIGVKDVEFAFKVVNNSNQRIVGLSKLIGDNEKENELIRVLEIIKREKSILNAELTDKTRWLNLSRRTEILTDLESSKSISVEKEGRTKRFTFLKN